MSGRVRLARLTDLGWGQRLRTLLASTAPDAPAEAPVLVLVGEHDEATPPPMSRELAASLPDARLKIIAGCAHVPQMQSPDAFLDAIGDFLASDASVHRRSRAGG